MEDLTLNATVPAEPNAVWSAWTDPAIVAAWLSPTCTVEPRVGGAFEIHFMANAQEGERGSEGCVFVALQEPWHLAFTWNFPPHLTTIRDARTRVDLKLSGVRKGTALQLRQSGWQSGGEWAEGRAYFETAWRRVLDALVAHFAG
ncbi:MAG: hypothetical protein ACI9U2_002569 [Bradymonadia bacterium]|jgi:uncharacterized protein YndB with AHSA1/START domain